MDLPIDTEEFDVIIKSIDNTTELYKKLNTLESSIPNLHILNRNSVKIGNYCIIGCTLWSLIPENGKFPVYRVRINDMTKYKYNKND